jgi:hypothetical protein
MKVVIVVTVSKTTETGGQTEGVALKVERVVYVPPAVRVWSVVGAATELAWETTPSAVEVWAVVAPTTELTWETTLDAVDVCSPELAVDDTEPGVTIGPEDETEAGMTLAAALEETGRDVTIEPTLEATGRDVTIPPAPDETDNNVTAVLVKTHEQAEEMREGRPEQYEA